MTLNPRADRAPLALIALLFAVATYSILSLRAELAPQLTSGLVSPRRLVGVGAGAVLFWAILRRLDGMPPAERVGPGRLLGLLGIAALGLLGVRVAFGQLVESQGVPLAQDVRWTIVWLGYLGLSTGLYLAHRLSAESPAAVAAPAGAPASDRDAAIAWLVEATLAECATDTPADRRDLARRLRARAGYRSADPLAAAANDRIALIERIAARLSE